MNIAIVYYLIFFVVGGCMMCMIMYLGMHSKTYWSAFLAILPLWTIVPLVSMYYNSGIETSLAFAQSLIIISIPWLLYASCIVMFAQFFGLFTSISIACAVYVVCAVIINWLRKI